MNLLQNVHDCLNLCENDFICKGLYSYYHYLCDGVDDRGWGCGYRTLQTLCSWVQFSSSKVPLNQTVPTIADIQCALVDMDDKPAYFSGSKQWIGSFEVCLCLDHFYEVPCKIIHIAKGSEVHAYFQELKEHFETVGSPIMMGGETDNASKGIMGVRLNDPALLIVDPHFSENPTSNKQLHELGYVKWMSLDDLHANSFYNLCLPKCKSKTL